MIMKQFQIVHKMTIKICSLQRYIKTLFIAFQFCQCLQSNIRLSIQFLLHDPGGLVKAFILFCHLVYKNWFDVSISFYRERFSRSCYEWNHHSTIFLQHNAILKNTAYIEFKRYRFNYFKHQKIHHTECVTPFNLIFTVWPLDHKQSNPWSMYISYYTNISVTCNRMHHCVCVVWLFFFGVKPLFYQNGLISM